MRITATSAETRKSIEYSAKLFTNKALAEACHATKEHPYFAGRSMDSALGRSWDDPTLLPFRILEVELYLKANPAYQAVLEAFVKAGAHKHPQHELFLHNSDFNPLRNILGQLESYARENGIRLKKDSDKSDLKADDKELAELLDSVLLTPYGKYKFIDHAIRVDRTLNAETSPYNSAYDPTIESDLTEEFWAMRRCLQRLEYLDKKDPLYKLIAEKLALRYEALPRHLKTPLETIKKPIEAFIELLTQLIDDTAIEKNIYLIETGKFVTHGLPEFSRHLSYYDLWMFKDPDKGEEGGYIGSSNTLLHKIYMARGKEDRVALYFIVAYKNGTEAQRWQLLKIAKNFGFEKDVITNESDINQIIELISRRVEIAKKVLQDAFAKRKAREEKEEKEKASKDSKDSKEHTEKKDDKKREEVKEDKNQLSPLHVASKAGRLDEVQRLLKKSEVDLGGKKTQAFQDFLTNVVMGKADKDNFSPFEIACKQGHCDIVQLYLTIVEEAFGNDSKGFKDFLIKKDKDHIPPFQRACKEGHRNLIKLLLDYIKKTFKGGYVFGNVYEPEGYSYGFGGHQPDYKYFLSEDDNDHLPPLHTACREGHVEVVKFLIDEVIEANLDTPSFPRYDYPSRDPRSNDKVKFGLFFFLTQKDKDHFTALHRACESANLDLVKLILTNAEGVFGGKNTKEFGDFLIGLGGRIRIRNGDHFNCYGPLNKACGSGNIEVVKLLLRTAAQAFGGKKTKGFQEFVTNGNETLFSPLTTALSAGHLDIAQLLQDNIAEAFCIKTSKFFQVPLAKTDKDYDKDRKEQKDGKEHKDDKQKSTTQRLVEIISDQKPIPLIAFMEKVNQLLHDTCIDKMNINPVPSLINMLHALDDAFKQISPDPKKPSVERKRIKILKKIYLNHLGEILLFGTFNYEQRKPYEVTRAQIEFVYKSPLLRADTAVASLFRKEEKSSETTAARMIDEHHLSPGQAPKIDTEDYKFIPDAIDDDLPPAYKTKKPGTKSVEAKEVPDKEISPEASDAPLPCASDRTISPPSYAEATKNDPPYKIKDDTPSASLGLS